MTGLYLEFDKIVRELANKNFRYAVVGGLAIGLHGFIRATEDMDFIIDTNNMDEMRSTMMEISYRLTNDPWRFPESQLKLWRFSKPIEFSEDMIIVDFLEADNLDNLRIIDRAVKMDFGDIELKVAAKDDLIAMKQYRNSKKDKIDIDFLREDRADEKI